jgi:predicted amidophosphoribosyltransferase
VTTTPTTTPAAAGPGPDQPTAICPACGQQFTRTGRRIWCSDACKQAAWRRRHPPAAPPQLPPSQHRRDHTIYQCGECGQRQTGRQWCQDCNRPCQRIGPGGDCPACGEPVALSDLIPGT